MQKCIDELAEDQMSKMMLIYQIQNWAPAKKLNSQIKNILESSLLDEMMSGD